MAGAGAGAGAGSSAGAGSGAGPAAGGRRYDPERRQRIIDAAIRVVGAKGIAGLSHRSVAAEADVPLGSTTYHFKTLDELLVAALRQANQAFTVTLPATPAPAGDVAGSLARLLGRLLAADRGRVELEYELYLAALQPWRCGRWRRSGTRRWRPPSRRGRTP